MVKKICFFWSHVRAWRTNMVCTRILVGEITVGMGQTVTPVFSRGVSQTHELTRSSIQCARKNITRVILLKWICRARVRTSGVRVVGRELESAPPNSQPPVCIIYVLKLIMYTHEDMSPDERNDSQQYRVRWKAYESVCCRDG